MIALENRRGELPRRYEGVRRNEQNPLMICYPTNLGSTTTVAVRRPRENQPAASVFATRWGLRIILAKILVEIAVCQGIPSPENLYTFGCILKGKFSEIAF